ncbi:MAG: hypothetical protein AB7V20_13800 [Phycisphaerales bacterium]
MIPSGHLLPSLSGAEVTDHGLAGELEAIDVHDHQRRPDGSRVRNSSSRARVAATNLADTVDFAVERAATSPTCSRAACW